MSLCMFLKVLHNLALSCFFSLIFRLIFSLILSALYFIHYPYHVYLGSKHSFFRPLQLETLFHIPITACICSLENSFFSVTFHSTKSNWDGDNRSRAKFPGVSVSQVSTACVHQGGIRESLKRGVRAKQAWFWASPDLANENKIWSKEEQIVLLRNQPQRREKCCKIFPRKESWETKQDPDQGTIWNLKQDQEKCTFHLHSGLLEALLMPQLIFASVC